MQTPKTISGFKTGLVLNQPQQIIVDDGFPVLQNAFCYLNQVVRRNSNYTINRLERQFSNLNYFVPGASPWSFNLLTINGYISAANNANPGQVTTISPHGLSNGDHVIISNVLGATGYNNVDFTITVVDTYNFTVGVNAAAFGAYVSGGVFISNRSISSSEPNASLVLGSVSITLTDAPTITLSDTGLGYLANLGTSQAITGITNGSSTVISFGGAPIFTIGSQVWITGVDNPPINQIPLTITAVGASDITVSFNSIGYPSWTSGGTVYPYGGTINYSTGDVVAIFSNAPTAATISYDYYPALPVMAIFDRNVANSFKSNVFFDTKYAYVVNQTSTSDTFSEFIPGYTWSWSDYEFPWCTNYWRTGTNYDPIFWITNLPDAAGGQPIRYTTGIGSPATWVDYTPTVDGTNNLYQAKMLFPFRGMFIALNTREGTTIGGTVNYRSRVRVALGDPLDTQAFDSSVPGKGFFRDLSTTEAIQAAWIFPSQVVIQTDSKTWVLSYTGVGSLPFRIDPVDDQLGTYSLYGSANFGDRAIGIGNRLFQNIYPTQVTNDDEKIVNFVFSISRLNQGLRRVYSVRNYTNRTVSYAYPYDGSNGYTTTYPNRRLVYNYDNQSWAIFEDSITALGYFQSNFQITWQGAQFPWDSADLPWNFVNQQESLTCGGNQQGYVFYLDFQERETPSLYISSISTPPTTAAIFTSPNHNLGLNDIVELKSFVGSYAVLNGIVGKVQILTANTFSIYEYDATTNRFSDPLIIDISVSYPGGGEVAIRRNFSILTKAFNNIGAGQSIHCTYLDATITTQQNTYVTLNAYDSLNISNPVNQLPDNATTSSLSGNKLSLGNPTSYPMDQINNRAFINQRTNAIAFQFTLDDATMASQNYSVPFQISSMTIWSRPAGRPLMPLGGG